MIYDQNVTPDSGNSSFVCTPTSRTNALALLKDKLQQERHKFKLKIEQIKQGHVKEINELKCSFAAEVENLQECMANSCDQCCVLAERLRISEEVMDSRYTNHLKQKFIYETKLKELEEIKLRQKVTPESMVMNRLKFENNRNLMVIEDLAERIRIFEEKVALLHENLRKSKVTVCFINEIQMKNDEIPLLHKHIETIEKKLNLYSGRKTQSELKHKGPHLFSIYQDIIQTHGEGVKEVMRLQKTKNGEWSLLCSLRFALSFLSH